MERLAKAVVFVGTTLVMSTINAMVLGTLMAFNSEVSKVLNPPRNVDCDDNYDSVDCDCECQNCKNQ